MRNVPTLSQPVCRRFTAILLGILITLVAMEGVTRCWVTARCAPQSHAPTFDIKLSLSAEPTPPGAKRVFLLGDSKMWHGIYPELLQAKLGTPQQPVMVTNHSVDGATPEMNHVVLAYALAHGIKPDVVVYNVSPMLLNQTYFRSWKATPRRAFDASFIGRCVAPGLLKKPQPLWQRFTCQIKRVSILVQQRSFMAEQVKQQVTEGAPLLFRPTILPLSGRAALPHLGSSFQGWAPASEMMHDLAKHMDLPAFINAVKMGESLTPYVEDATELRQFIHYCQQEHIPLVLIWLPEHPAMKQVYQALGAPPPGHVEQRLKHLADVTQPTAPVWFLNFRDTDTNAEHYYNPDHQNVMGAVATTERLAPFLVRTIGPHGRVGHRK